MIAVIETPSKPAFAPGFTPFAYSHLITITEPGHGFPSDHKKRVYVLGGKGTDGARYRHELRGTIMAAFAVYVEEDNASRLWVYWKDGRKHLVHRKA